MSGTRKSINMLCATGSKIDVVGSKIKADGYYGLSDGVHTIQAQFTNFIGGFGIQGTLSLDPQPEDWAWISLNGLAAYDDPGYLNLPIADESLTGTFLYSVTGNFTYIRAVLTRTHLGVGEATFDHGEITKVLVSL